METTTNKPIDKVRLGAIVATIWENESENGPWYNVTLTRTYRDKKTDKLEDGSSLSGNDILAGAEALRLAYLRIHELRSASKSDEAA